MGIFAVKEIYYTLQGEGANAGRAAVFCRFAGCNLWSGREQDRAKAVCRFCDTEFIGTDGINGGRFDEAAALAAAILSQWPSGAGTGTGVDTSAFVVLTGGEPMLQVDAALIDALHDAGFEIAIETNGTLQVPRAIDWICVSPKAGAALKQRSGDELKLVYPQVGLAPEAVADLAFTHFYLQPMDSPESEANTQAAIRYCKSNPHWRLSIQSHKMLGIP